MIAMVPVISETSTLFCACAVLSVLQFFSSVTQNSGVSHKGNFSGWQVCSRCNVDTQKGHLLTYVVVVDSDLLQVNVADCIFSCERVCVSECMQCSIQGGGGGGAH